MPDVSSGRPYPIGATLAAGGVNFSVYSSGAARVELLLFDRPEDGTPAAIVPLDAERHRTHHWWHVHVGGIGPGQLYGYRADGPAGTASTLRFDGDKLLLDPYALAVANMDRYDRERAKAPGGNAEQAMKSVVVDPSAYDWEGDVPPRRLLGGGVIYELHVGGFTRDPSAPVVPARRGTYAGLVDEIECLRDLGVASVELMPVQQYDPQASPTGTNYWGYQPVAWFAPHRGYCSGAGLLDPVDEFRDMVKAFHRAGIEVILDVVLNHTAEDGADGPTLSLRGLDDPTYYILEADDPLRYVNATGTGNTVNANHPVVRRMIRDCLRHWVEHMHVDGFRFDLASSLTRGEDGRPLKRPPLILDLEADPVLADVALIAEPWDATGLYQVADFPGERWAVWNGTFRDNVRRFVRGDAGTVVGLADALTGSAQLFGDTDRDARRSVNFVTSHDGFTLNDLVSYDVKHNEDNGEGGRDGTDANDSWNCGVEGPSDDAEVETLRRRQMRNLLTILLLSQGRPMLLMGDEVRRTQGGNNNPYNQDGPVSWLRWDAASAQGDLLRFVRGLIRFRERSDVFRASRFWGTPGGAEVRWHGVRLDEPDWGELSHTLALELRDAKAGLHLHLMLNAFHEPLDFELPDPRGDPDWGRLADTGRTAPGDLTDPPEPLGEGVRACRVEAHSTVVLVAGYR